MCYACRIILPSYWQVVVIAIIAPLAGTFMDTTALITCTRNFPSERGTVIGIVKACIGKFTTFELASTMASWSMWHVLYIWMNANAK